MPKLTLAMRDTVLRRILESLEHMLGNAPSAEGQLTEYWERHLSAVKIEPLGNGRVRLSGESGFYFPGHTYSGLDLLNTVAKAKQIRRLRAVCAKRGDHRLVALLSLGIPEVPGQKLGYRLFGQRVSYDFFRAIFHIYSILHTCREPKVDLPSSPRIVEIGSGSGLLALAGALVFPQSVYILVDLPQVLSLAAIFLSTVLPDRSLHFFHEWSQGGHGALDIDPFDHAGHFVFVPHYAMSRIPECSCDLAINTDSMQEMTMQTITAYFQQIRRVLRGPRLFYQSNRRVKTMDGQPIAVDGYPYLPEDRHLMDRENEFMSSLWVVRRELHNLVPLLAREKRSRATMHIQRLTVMAASQNASSIMRWGNKGDSIDDLRCQGP